MYPSMKLNHYSSKFINFIKLQTDFDEVVVEDLVDFGSPVGVALQNVDDEVGGGVAHAVLWDDVLVLFDARVGLLERIGFKGRLAHQQRVHDAARAPNVDLEAVSLLRQNLRRDVVWRPAQRLFPLVFARDLRRQAKVTDFDVQLVVKENVAQLK